MFVAAGYVGVQARWRRFQSKAISLDLKELNIADMKIASGNTSVRNELNLARRENRAVLTLPEDTIATNILRYNGEILVKVVSVSRNWEGNIFCLRVCLLGKDVTNQPFMLELPEEYADKTIEECERWVTRSTKADEVVST